MLHMAFHILLKQKKNLYFILFIDSFNTFKIDVCVCVFVCTIKTTASCCVSWCFEQAHYNHLHKWLNHKWDFIVMQAAEQYKQVKPFQHFCSGFIISAKEFTFCLCLSVLSVCQQHNLKSSEQIFNKEIIGKCYYWDKVQMITFW